MRRLECVPVAPVIGRQIAFLVAPFISAARMNPALVHAADPETLEHLLGCFSLEYVAHRLRRPDCVLPFGGMCEDLAKRRVAGSCAVLLDRHAPRLGNKGPYFLGLDAPALLRPRTLGRAAFGEKVG